jgi:hypothetical protein
VTLSQQFDVTVIGVSSVGWITGGPWKGRKVIGCSLAVGPGGAILATGSYGHDAECLVSVDLEPRSPIGFGSDFSKAARQRIPSQGKR